MPATKHVEEVHIVFFKGCKANLLEGGKAVNKRSATAHGTPIESARTGA
jgi:hypothetical protein